MEILHGLQYDFVSLKLHLPADLSSKKSSKVYSMILFHCRILKLVTSCSFLMEVLLCLQYGIVLLQEFEAIYQQFFPHGSPTMFTVWYCFIAGV